MIFDAFSRDRSMTVEKETDLLATYNLRDEVVIEDFEDCSLVLLCDQLRLVQLNPTARNILNYLDGNATVQSIVETVALIYDEPRQKVISGILELLSELRAQGVVERCDK